MEERDVRSLAVLATLLVFFPLWIGLMHASHHAIVWLEQALGLGMPRWLKHGYYLLLFGWLLVGLGYRTARWLDRKYPGSAPRSAAWEDAGKD